MNLFHTVCPRRPGAGMRALLPAALLLAALYAPHAGAAPTKDPLDVPAAMTRLTTTTQLSGIARAGKRLVAVGVRGLIITSDDEGANWTQRPAPVSSDLLAVQFPTPAKGWAVGHDGVILHSDDGGAHWRKQFDGRQAARELTAHFTQLAQGGDAEAQRLLGEIKLNYENGPEQALLDLWFEDELRGYVCGSFGTLLATTDGGKTWRSMVEHIEYGSLLHLNAIRGAAGTVFIASEKGIVFKLDRARQRFVPTETGYKGSFFSLAAAGDTVVAAGLRGTAYRSGDGGATWEPRDTGLIASITGAAADDGGPLLMVSQNGSLLRGDRQGAHFSGVRVARPGVLSGVVGSGGGAVVVGYGGVQQVPLK